MNLSLDDRFEELLQELVTRIERLLPHDGHFDLAPGIRLFRNSKLTEEVYGESKSAFCVVAQGAKEMFLGGTRHRYDTRHYLLATVDMPLTSILLAPEESKPFLSMRVEIEPSLVHSIMVETGLSLVEPGVDCLALGVSRLEPELLDAALRLMRLSDDPAAMPVLLPMIVREMVFRILRSEQGPRLLQMGSPGGHTALIALALERLRRDFDQPLRLDDLASSLGMSRTNFHHHFKLVTDMTPLQFQKQLRLQEARRLMLSEELTAASAGQRVGYDDASHFSRDYKRHFGHSPVRDVERLRVAVS